MYQDRSLTCRDCAEEFIFSAGEQAFFATKGLTNDPQRCPSCRAVAKRARANEGPREFHAAICGACGGQAIVPFAPRNDRPVYCSSCFDKVRAGTLTSVIGGCLARRLTRSQSPEQPRGRPGDGPASCHDGRRGGFRAVQQEEVAMGVIIIREMVGTSPQSWSDAARQAVATASKTVRNIVHGGGREIDRRSPRRRDRRVPRRGQDRLRIRGLTRGRRLAREARPSQLIGG